MIGENVSDEIKIELELTRWDCLKAGMISNYRTIIILLYGNVLIALAYSVLYLIYKFWCVTPNNTLELAIKILGIITVTLPAVIFAAIIGIYNSTTIHIRLIGILDNKLNLIFHKSGEFEIVGATTPPVKIKGMFRLVKDHYILYEVNKFVPDLILPKRCFESNEDFEKLETILTDNGVQKIK